MGSVNPKVASQEVVGQERPHGVIKYDKPKILLLDLERDAFDALNAFGYNVKEGSLGQPYRVLMSSGYEPLLSTPRLPNYAEQEIVVVDLQCEVADHPVGEKERPDGELDLWAKCDSGVIDPRMRAAAIVQKDFDRVLDVGGVFVVFAAQKSRCLVQVGSLQYRTFEPKQDCNWDEWGFLSELREMEVSSDHGEEMSVVDQSSPLGKLLKTHLPGSAYDCTVQGGWPRNAWQTLAINKFGQPVALYRSRDSKGLVIVLPQLKDKTGFVKSLFTDVLPEMAAHLFPGIERGRWTHFPEYELPKVLELQSKRSQIEARFKADLAAVEQEVLQARKQDGWTQDLLTQTGDPLVAAVKTGLSALGFSKVVDMDEVRDKQGKSRREDLQIQDVSPILVVDVKGIANFPGDEDVLQAGKHATLVMRDQNRTDVFGLSLINHQRHLPPMERENAMPFRQELIDVALNDSLGLMTAWDFYRLVRNARALNWAFENVRPILYRCGRIEVIPTHYQYIGKVTKVWSEKFGVEIQQGTVAVGNKIAIEFPVLFEETDVVELVVNDSPLVSAKTGDKTGIPWPILKPRPKLGLRVFAVSGYQQQVNVQ